MTRLNVKICCINSIAEARMAMDYGAATLGLVGHMPSGPGVIEDALIKEIAHNFVWAPDINNAALSLKLVATCP